MSKSIVIKEVDTNKTLSNVAKLKTNKSGGGSVYWVPEDEVQLGTKSVTQNGTYTAASDGKYGFSQFSVNVRGGNGSADSHGKPTGGDIKPGGAGSAVTGTDPETGEEVVVGVDEDGNIVQTPIPYGIKIVTPPTKTDYVYQETMDYSGIGVKLTNKNGDTYTDVDHPSGWYVNPADLIFPVEKAPAASGSSDSYSGGGVHAIKINCTLHGVSYYYNVTYTPTDLSENGSSNRIGYFGTGEQSILVTRYKPDDYHYNVLARPLQFSVTSLVAHVDGNNNIRGHSSGFGLSPNSWDIYAWDNSAWIDWLIKVPESTTDPNTVPLDDLKPDATATIPVQWVNPYTGEIHQDTFKITSTSASGDAHTSTSSNGTEGSGGGGSF